MASETEITPEEKAARKAERAARREAQERERAVRYPYVQNRELSWLKFNERVLEEAFDENVPLLERLRYIAIFGTNLDEFFMVRVGSLLDIKVMRPRFIDSKTGWTIDEQIEQIRAAVRPLYARRDEAFYQVEEALRQQGIASLETDEWLDADRKFIRKFYESAIAPVLSPQIVDAHHPFPHLPNKKIFVMAWLGKPGKKKRVLGLVPLPDNTSSIVYLPPVEGDAFDVRYTRLSRIIAAYLPAIFPGYEICEENIVCVTRNADIDPTEEGYDVDEDIRYRMKRLLKRRQRLAPVRVECTKPLAPEIQKYLLDELGVPPEAVYCSRAPLTLEYLGSLTKEIAARQGEDVAASMLFEPFEPAQTPALPPTESAMAYLDEHDVLLSYPYQSMDFFLRVLREAATDDAVISIRITIYRLSRRSRLVDYLCRAAEEGKDVTVLVELRARFDEENNINWSEKLEDAGCTVMYGLDGYKVHSKLCLITRRVDGELRHITHVGTGNFNETTARVYTDLSLLTSDDDIGRDAAEIFRNVGVSYLEAEYDTLWASPSTMRTNIITELEAEAVRAREGQTDEGQRAGRGGRAILKMNSLTDIEVIDALVRASQADVQIDLIVRGICCLLPGVEGYTDNIRVTSIIGRFLEHSRVYWFGDDDVVGLDADEPRVFISSADFMIRNLSDRVEVAGPVRAPELRARVREILDIELNEQTKRWVLGADGTYTRLPASGEVIDSQKFLLEAAAQDAAQDPSQGTGRV
ncbi:MAG: polyphosphate kinase 1 [Coriobacteriia bacterium]|nr:polyphosphate kinase 1 [Coriobacteriia bacterium]